MSRFLTSLNEPQKKAVLHNQGPLVVFAGAGSGKTRVITTRIARLIEEQGIQPYQILALTFTNKAAQEMKERVLHMSPYGSMVHVGTFHSMCARWLREFAPYLGFTSDFTIYNEQHSLSCIKTILENLNITKNSQARDFLNAIRQAKTQAISPREALLKEQYYSGNLFPQGGVHVYKRYQEYLVTCNAMDFGDLLMNTLLLLESHPEVRARLSARYKHILVDEFQDTNPLQFSIVSSLLTEHKNLFVVGDDDQSIYSWRGANPQNILTFKSLFEGAEEVRLEQNYRCSKNIVSAAKNLIKNNKIRAEKTLYTDNADGELIDYLTLNDGIEETSWVVQQIKKDKDKYPYHETGIFYRTNYQSRQIEDSLRQAHIPYRIYGSLKFYERLEIQDLVAYLRFLTNLSDDIALKRIINTPTRGIGQKTISDIEILSHRQNIPMYQALTDFVQQNSQTAAGKKLQNFKLLIDILRTHLSLLPLNEFYSFLLEQIAYKSYLEKKFPDQFQDKIANIHELNVALQQHMENSEEKTLVSWLNTVSLVDSEETNQDSVALLTLHASKGLEFDRVFILGVEDGLIPHSNSLEDPLLLEEERRLLYVGITRAKKKLSLLAARKRKNYQNWVMNDPSRFIREIPTECFTTFSGHSRSAASEIKAGDVVFHETYGKGYVYRLDINQSSRKAFVDFVLNGQRSVNVEYLHKIKIML